MIQLPNNKKCYNLPEQVAQNLLNIQYLAEEYKNIDELPAIWRSYKETFDAEQETFSGWTTTFEGWDTTLSTYLANMSSAAVGAIAGQNIAPANVAATGNITANSIIENMTGYTFTPDGNLVSNGLTLTYVGVVKNGNKITFVIAGYYDGDVTAAEYHPYLGNFKIPSEIGAKLFPMQGSYLEFKKILLSKDYQNNKTLNASLFKINNTTLGSQIFGIKNETWTSDNYVFRFETTFLLSDSLVS